MCATTGRLPAQTRQQRRSSYSRDRGGKHPEQHLAGFAELMQAHAYAGFNRLYEANGQRPVMIGHRLIATVHG